MQEICKGYSDAYGANIELGYNFGYPATINYKKETDFAVKVAKEISGDNNVEDDAKPDMGAEDFSFMLHERPGLFSILDKEKVQEFIIQNLILMMIYLQLVQASL